MSFSQFLSTLTHGKDAPPLHNPLNAELYQGEYYLDRKREMTMRLKPNLKLIEAYNSPKLSQSSRGYVSRNVREGFSQNDYVGGGGSGEPPPDDNLGGGGAGEPPSDDEGELGALEDKFNTLLSKYGTTYKSYMQNVNRFMGKQNSMYANKNIKTNEGDPKIWYVNKYGVARQYPSLQSYNNRAHSCAGNFMNVSFGESSFRAQGLSIGPPMNPGEPCGLEGQNVELKQLSGHDHGSPCGSGGECGSGICSPGGCTKPIPNPPWPGPGPPPPPGPGPPKQWPPDRPPPHHYPPYKPWPPEGPYGPNRPPYWPPDHDWPPTPPPPGPSCEGDNTDCTNTDPNVLNCCAYTPGGSAPPIEYCGKFVATLGCDAEGEVDWEYMDKQANSKDNDCGLMVSTNESGYCECADGTIKARVNCGHPSFTCEMACAPGGDSNGPGGGPVWEPYKECMTYEGGAGPEKSPLLCLKPSDGSCWLPDFGPVVDGQQRAGLASCSQLNDHIEQEYGGAQLIKNFSFPHRIADSCDGQGSVCGTPGEVCPWGVTGAAETSFGSGPDFARNYKCCDIRGQNGWQWQKIGAPTDDCPDYDETVTPCGCDWTMYAGDSRPTTALTRFNATFGNSKTGVWGQPFKWCAHAVDRKSCEGKIAGSNCRYNVKKNCVSTATTPGRESPQACKARSYALVKTGVKGNYGRTDVGNCVNTGDLLATRKGTLGELTELCDQWPGCRFVDFSYTSGAGGPYGMLYPQCTVDTQNQTRQVYDSGQRQAACYPNVLPGGQIDGQPDPGHPFTPTNAPFPSAAGGKGKCHKGSSCPHMYGYDSKATQESKCAAACCTFTDHWYGNDCS